MKTMIRNLPEILLGLAIFMNLIKAWVPSHKRPRCPFTKLSDTYQNCHTTLISSRISQLFLVSNDLAEDLTLDGLEIRKPIEMVSNFLLVKLKDTLTATGGGILLPDESKEKPTEGLVMAVGPGRAHPHSAIRIENPIEPGTSVLFGKFEGTPVEYKGEDCQIVRDDSVLLAYTGVTMRLNSVRCVRDYVLVELEQNTNNVVTRSGVVIAAQVMRDEEPCTGRVVLTGPGRATSYGKASPSPVVPGDFVKFKDYAGNDVMIEGKSYSVVKMVDILCTLKTEKGDAENED